MVLLAAAGAVGWWAHGANTTVMAQGAGGGEQLSFTTYFDGGSPHVTMYNPVNRTFYLYDSLSYPYGPVACSYKFVVTAPGATLQRQNCQTGEMLSGFQGNGR